MAGRLVSPRLADMIEAIERISTVLNGVSLAVLNPIEKNDG